MSLDRSAFFLNFTKTKTKKKKSGDELKYLKRA